MSYNETKKAIDGVREEYGCKGEIIFRAAFQAVIEDGIERLNDEGLTFEWFRQINERHDKAEAEGTTLFMGREFEKAILECSIKLAKFKPMELLQYMQHEWLYYEPGEIDYERAIEMLEQVIDYEGVGRSISGLINILKDIGFKDEELEQFNFAEEDIYGEDLI